MCYLYKLTEAVFSNLAILYQEEAILSMQTIKTSIHLLLRRCFSNDRKKIFDGFIGKKDRDILQTDCHLLTVNQLMLSK